jgi:hypothetical protein
MRLFILFLSFIICISLINCGRKCDSYIDRPLKGKIEEYFGVYKPANWWVYSNRTGTKKDSQYVADYEEIFSNNKTSCERTQQRTFAIVNSQLPGRPPLYAYGDSLYLVYKREGNIISVYSIIPFGTNSRTASFSQFYYFLDTDSIKSTLYSGSFVKNTFDSISLNSSKYYSILIGNDGSTTFYLAKNRGLVGWGNSLDTFNLVNFKIF